MTRKPIFGLIGAIGAGKSMAATILARHGATIIDADKLGHDVLESPQVKPHALARWPQVQKPEGTIDRRAVAAIVFANGDERRTLERWVFPEIRRRCEAAIADAMANPGVLFIVLDAAVMLEAGWTTVCDKLIYIDAPRPLRVQRVAARSGWSEADLTAREEAQMPAARKMRHADVIFVNDGTPAELDQKISTWLTEQTIPSC